MKTIELELLQEALEKRHEEYYATMKKYFSFFSDFCAVKDLMDYEINQEVFEDAYAFALELSRSLGEIKALKRVIKDHNFDPLLLAVYETLEVGFSTIVRGAKKRVMQKLTPLLAQFSIERLERYNQSVLPCFRFSSSACS